MGLCTGVGLVGRRPDDAFTAEQFAEMYDDLLRLANVVAPPGVDGSDLLHDAVASCLGRFRRRGLVDEPRSYLGRAIINEARAKRRRWARQTAATASDRITDEPAGAGDAMALIDQLPPRQRACLYLRFVEDQSVEATARLLGCSPGTVKSQTAKGLSALRRPVASLDGDLEVSDP